MGRRLAGAKKNNKTYLFTYNDEGLRTSKTKNGVTTTYYLNGSRIVAEETSGNLTVYIYDASGSPIGMQYRGANYIAGAWDIYWYEKNLQGDIVAVYEESGVKVASYVYDAWGNHETYYHHGGQVLSVVKNPFRYRGYYYDIDLGLYYLNSRYYDSVVGRFINADSSLYHNIFGYNMFAYCNNNPVNYYDQTGENADALFMSWLTGVGSAALSEPTLIGEIILIVGVVAIGVIWLGEQIADGTQVIEDIIESQDDPPQSITEPPDKSNEKVKDDTKPSSPGTMQREVEKGQAPKDIESVHKPHNTKTGKPHIHLRNGTSMNNDGSPHDAHKGIPHLTKKIKDWLSKHNWATEYNIFP